MAGRKPDDVELKQQTDAPVATPAVTQSQRNIKDGDPIDEKKWAPPADERPYADAVTDEHREHLDEYGMAPVVEKKSKG